MQYLLHRFVLFTLMAIACMGPAASLTFGGIEFFAPRAYDGGLSFTTGDINGDGHLDLISGKHDRITVNYGNGQGKLSTLPSDVFVCRSFTNNAFAVKPMIGEFTGDGKTDVAAWVSDRSCTTWGLDGLLVLPGNGSGQFLEPQFTSVSPVFIKPDYTAAGDFDHDGVLDVAIAQAYGNEPKGAVFINTGTGTFGTPVENDARFSPLTADINGDTHVDLIYSSPFGGIMIIKGDGAGGFGPAGQIDSNPFKPGAVGDFNNDGKTDLFGYLLGNNNVPSYRAYRQTDSGTLVTGGQGNLSVRPDAVHGAVAAEFTGDGNLDVAVMTLGRTVILRGLGNGAFVEDGVYGLGATKLATGDFNGDGVADLVTNQMISSSTNGYGGPADEALVALNNGKGVLMTAPVFEVPFGGVSVATADFDRDGLLDMVTTGNWNDPELLFLYQTTAPRGVGKTGGVTEQHRTDGGGRLMPRVVISADFNNDGYIDIGLAGQSWQGQPTVRLFKNQGFREFYDLNILNVPIDVNDMIAGHFNGDQFIDLAFAGYRNQSFTVFVAMGNGNHTFQTPIGYMPGNFGANALASADVNGDGRNDILVGRSDRMVTALVNDGLGRFNISELHQTGSNLTDLAAADIDGDNDADLVGVDDQGKMYTLKGIGNGSFEPPVTQTVAIRSRLSAQRIVLADIDGDEYPEAVINGDSVISVYRNDRTGVFFNKTMWGGGTAMRDIAVRDIDGDGLLDVIFSGGFSGVNHLGFLFNASTEDVSASISGRVLSPSGLPLRNITVRLRDAEGAVRTATTSSFGTYSFQSVTTGTDYQLSATSKRYRFAPRSVTPQADIANFDLLGQE